MSATSVSSNDVYCLRALQGLQDGSNFVDIFEADVEVMTLLPQACEAYTQAHDLQLVFEIGLVYLLNILIFDRIHRHKLLLSKSQCTKNIGDI